MILATFRDLELRILHWITCDLAGPAADRVAEFANNVLKGAVVFAVLFLLSLATRRGRERFPRVVLTLLLTMGAVHLVREIVWRTLPRTRPGRTFEDARKLTTPAQWATCGDHPDLWVERDYAPKSSSFPSSHTVTGGACAIALTYASPALGVAGWLYAGVEGFGRLYWGKHWPTDVLGALVLAALLGVLAWRASPRLLHVLGRLLRRRPVPVPPPPPVPDPPPPSPATPARSPDAPAG